MPPPSCPSSPRSSQAFPLSGLLATSFLFSPLPLPALLTPAAPLGARLSSALPLPLRVPWHFFLSLWLRLGSPYARRFPSVPSFCIFFRRHTKTPSHRQLGRGPEGQKKLPRRTRAGCAGRRLPGATFYRPFPSLESFRVPHVRPSRQNTAASERLQHERFLPLVPTMDSSPR